MKKWLNSFMVGSVMVLALSGSLQAIGQEMTRSLKINRDGKVGDQMLAKGEYTLKFTDGKSGEMVFLRGKKEVVKAPYEITQLNQPAGDTTVVFKAAADGTLQVSRIEFKGSNNALVFK